MTVSAAVNRNRNIMWHVVEGKWNGETAAGIYKGPLLSALRRAYGTKRQYTLVEDGDRKGNQSGKGLRAKAEAGYKVHTLPPRTPSLMPLNYPIWHEIEERMDKSAPKGTESKLAFLKRLEKIAKSLPRSYIQKTVKRMKANLKDIIAAKGWHPKND